MIDVSTRLRELRGDRSLHSLSKETGLGITQIRKIESGELKYPTLQTIQKLLDAMGYELMIVKKEERL